MLSLSIPWGRVSWWRLKSEASTPVVAEAGLQQTPCEGEGGASGGTKSSSVSARGEKYIALRESSSIGDDSMLLA